MINLWLKYKKTKNKWVNLSTNSQSNYRSIAIVPTMPEGGTNKVILTSYNCSDIIC